MYLQIVSFLEGVVPVLKVLMTKEFPPAVAFFAGVSKTSG
jgi:hypothetical protein